MALSEASDECDVNDVYGTNVRSMVSLTCASQTLVDKQGRTMSYEGRLACKGYSVQKHRRDVTCRTLQTLWSVSFHSCLTLSFNGFRFIYLGNMRNVDFKCYFLFTFFRLFHSSTNLSISLSTRPLSVNQIAIPDRPNIYKEVCTLE